MYHALWIQEHPAAGATPPAADPLGPALVVLTRHLESLTASLASAGKASPQSSATSNQAAATLTRRIRYVRSLLLHLARIDPSYARRLAPELRALRRLLSELSRAAVRLQSTHDAAASGGAAIGPPGPVTTPQSSSRFVWGPALTPTAHLVVVGAAQDAESSQSHAGTRSANALGTKAAIPTTVSPSAAPQRARLLTHLGVSTGPSRSVSAASSGSTGSATGTLVTMFAVCMCLGILFGRLALIVLPWRLAVLGHRLERPG
jgi:hypothetical protein